jgi:hypothetical protein
MSIMSRGESRSVIQRRPCRRVGLSDVLSATSAVRAQACQAIYSPEPWEPPLKQITTDLSPLDLGQQTRSDHLKHQTQAPHSSSWERRGTREQPDTCTTLPPFDDADDKRISAITGQLQKQKHARGHATGVCLKARRVPFLDASLGAPISANWRLPRRFGSQTQRSRTNPMDALLRPGAGGMDGDGGAIRRRYAGHTRPGGVIWDFTADLGAAEREATSREGGGWEGEEGGGWSSRGKGRGGEALQLFVP